LAVHANAALAEDEAVRLLNHHANQADRRREVIPAERDEHFVLRFDYGHRGSWSVTVLEAFLSLRAFVSCRSLNDTAALSLFRFRDAALCEHLRGSETKQNAHRCGDPVPSDVHRASSRD